MTTQPPEPDQPTSSQIARRSARAGTLILTNTIKLGGLVIAINEAIIRTQLRPAALAEAAFMMAGAQISESVVLNLIDHFMGKPPP